TPQTVGFLLVPGFALMSYAAAVEPLRAANLISGQPLYRCWNAAPGGNPATFDDKSVFAWLRRLARKGVAVGGISGGPYILAKAGLLDERRATLHWEHLPAFREAFP